MQCLCTEQLYNNRSVSKIYEHQGDLGMQNGTAPF
jgi:hypothetical protein